MQWDVNGVDHRLLNLYGIFLGFWDLENGLRA